MHASETPAASSAYIHDAQLYKTYPMFPQLIEHPGYNDGNIQDGSVLIA